MLRGPPVLLASLVLIGLSTAPAGAGADPVARLEPFVAPHEACVVPASTSPGTPCPALGSPERDGVTACHLPAVYLGSRPGACPDRPEPPGSQTIPVGPAAVSR